MKKTSKTLLKVITVTIACLSFQTCEYWKNGDKFYKDVQEQVRVAGADKITVDCSYAQPNWGSINPGMNSDQKKEVGFKVTQVPAANFAFHHWAAFKKSNFNVKTSTLFWDDDVKTNEKGQTGTYYELNWKDKELGPDIVKFYNYDVGTKKEEIENAEYCNTNNDTGVYIANTYNDEDTIVIVPVVAKRMELETKNTKPKNQTENVVRNQRITIAFNKKINFETFVDTSVPETGLTDAKKINGLEYGWNEDVINIKITDAQDIEYSDPYGYFELPEYDEAKPKQFSISVKKGVSLPRYAYVDITIAASVEDSDGFSMADDIAYSFRTGNNKDDEPPIITDLSAGKRVTSSISILPSANQWLEYSGYLDEDSSLTSTSVKNDDVSNSTNLSYWSEMHNAEESVNEIFTHRVNDTMNIYLVIKDKVGGTLNNETADSDISYFVVKSRLLVDSQGNPPKDENGTVIQGGKYYANELYVSDDYTYNYDKVIYSSSTADFLSNAEQDKFKYPDGAGTSGGDRRLPGYGFIYKFPSDLPDGLIKVELYAVDATENSGEENPYAIYVIKDTTKPSVAENGHNITSQSETVISNWYNERTKKDFFIRVTEGSRINDLACAEMQPSIMYWSFSPTENPSDKWDVIDNTGATVKEMKDFADSIIDEGPVSIFAQLSDDLGNISEISRMQFNVNFDKTSPGDAQIESLTEPAKVYQNGSKYYSKETSIKFNLAAVDSENNTEETETSAGIAGFFTLDDTNAESLLNSLTTFDETKNLVNLKKATNGKTTVNLSAGEQANASKRTYYLYAVDRALNPSAQAVPVTIIQDTTGPEITVSINASYIYDSGKAYFRTSDEYTDWISVPGEKGAVKGIVNGTYYYNASQTSIPVKVTLKDYDLNNGGFGSGEKHFTVNALADENQSGTVLNLVQGEYIIHGYDNLKNVTDSSKIYVKQDTSAPTVTGFTLYEADGTTVLPLTQAGIASVKADKIGVQFKVKDTQTGIRKLEFVTADYSNAKLFVNGEEFTSETGIHNGNTFIFNTCLSPNVEYTIIVKDVELPDVEDEITLKVIAEDPTTNRTNEDTAGSNAKLNIDKRAPVISNIYFVNEGSTETVTDFNRRTIAEKFKIEYTEGLSGVEKIYVSVTNSADPFSAASFTVTAEDLPLVANDSTDTEKCILSNAMYPADRSGATLTLVLNSLTIDTVTGNENHEGTKTVTVKLEDAAGNISAAKTLNIIYDTTGPAITIDDNSSCEYVEGKYFRTSDTEVTKESTGTDLPVTNNAVAGLVAETDKYYYSSSEEYVTFNVSLADDSTRGCKKNLYYYDGKVNGVEQSDPGYTEGYQSGSSINLSEGTHVIYAKDLLGNVTKSPVITVIKDISAPAVTGFALYEANGTTVLPLTQAGIASVKADKIGVQFKVKDTQTGIRKLEFVTADYSNAKLFVNGEEFTSETGIHNGNTFIFNTCLSPNVEYTIIVKDVELPDVEDEITLKVIAEDPTTNRTNEDTAGSNAKLNIDKRAPVISNIYFVNEGSTETVTDFNRRTIAEKFKIEYTEGLSGVEKIYVSVTNSADPFSAASFTVIAEDLPLVANDSTDTEKCILSNAMYPADRSGATLTLVLNSLTIDTVTGNENHEGTKTVTVKLEDAAGNISAAKTLNIIYDTTGPAITIDDNSSCEYVEGKYFRTSDTEVTKESTGTDLPVTNNAVTGLVAETDMYYYSINQSYVSFNVTIQDDVKGCCKNLYYYDGKINGVEQTDPGYNNGFHNNSIITLSEGTHVIYAKDLLGNVTKSPVITVIKDISAPAVTGFALYEANGTTVLPLTQAGIASVKADKIGVQFKVKDTQTGIRKLEFVTADYSNAKLFVNGEEFTSETGIHNGNTFIFNTCLSPNVEYTIMVKDVELPDVEEEITLKVIAEDPTNNRTNEDTAGSNAKLNIDKRAPVISNIYFVNEGSTETVTDFNRRTIAEKFKIEYTEGLSGVEKIYVSVTNSADPFSAATFGLAAEGMPLVAKDSADTEKCILSNAMYPADATGAMLTFTLDSLTIDTVTGNENHEGTKTVTVKLEDAAGNISAAKTLNIIYDTTGPAITIDDNSSCEYVEGKYFRTSDTEVTKESTGTDLPVTNNAVAGLVAETDKYYYSSSEEYVTFNVSLADDSTRGCCKNLYYYDGKINGVEQTDPGYNNGLHNNSIITLSEGTHVIYAKDLLGNVTKSPVITVKQDKAVPVTTQVLIYGKDINNNEQTTSSVTSTVDIGVTLKDIDSVNNDTGVRSFTVSGDVKFTAPSTITRTVGSETVTLTKDTDYYVTGANNTSSETITFKYTQPSLSTYRFSGATLYLEQGDGTNTIHCDIKDATGNESVTVNGTIFCDSIPPVITNAAVVTVDASGKTNNNSTKTDNVKITFNVMEEVSGISRIYAVKNNETSQHIPTGQSMLVNSSTLTGAETAGSIGPSNGYIKFNVPSISANAQSVELSNVTFDEGDKAYTIYLFALDDAGNVSAPVSVNVNYDTTAPVVNEITINDIQKLRNYEDVENESSYKYILPANTFSANDSPADKVPVYVEFTEILSGVEFINLGGTAVIQNNTELYIVDGTTETALISGIDYELDVSSNKIHMLNSAEPLLKSDTTVKIKLSNIKFNNVDSSEANTISITLKDFAINLGASYSTVTSGSYSGIQNIYADSKKPEISTIIAVDRGGDAASGNLLSGETTDATNKTVANAGYTNENIVNVKVTVTAETTSSVTGSGIKSIVLTGADFTADTKVWLNESEPHHLSTEVSLDGSTVTFTNAIKNAYTVTITNVKLSTGDGTKTVSAELTDAVGWASDSQSYSIMLDTANPVWNVNEVFAAPYSDCNEKVYPHPNSETAFGKQLISNGPRYFYTSYLISGETKAVLGLHMTDANLRSAATGVYVKAADTTNADVIKTGSIKSAALNSTGFVKTNYSYWADFAPSSTIYTVAVMDEAGNVSEAKQFYVVEDITAPSAKDDSENFIDFAYVEQNNEADGERWEIFTVPVGTNYKNIFKSNGGNFTEHVKIEVPLANYMERGFSATYSGIEYYAVTDGAAPSSEQKSSSYAYGKWMNFTEGTTSLTIYPDMSNDRDALFLHFKDGAGNIQSIPVRTKVHAEVNENAVESWSIDDSINYDGNDDSISSLSGKDNSLSTIGNLVNDDGYFMTDETAGLNYISGNAKLHLTTKEDKSFTSSAIENNSENYSIKARIVISESEPTKSYIDNLTAEDVASQITQDWKYIGTTNSEAIEFVLEYPTAANESKLWLCIEDRVGNFTAEKIIFKYDQSNPDSDYAEKWTYDNEAPTVVVTKGGVTKEVEDIEATFDDIQFLISPNGINRAYCGKNNSGQKHIWVPSSDSLKYNFTANDNTNSIKGYKYLTSETEPALNTYNNYSDNWNNIYYSGLENNSDKDIYLFIRDYVGNVRMYHIGNEDVKFRKDDITPTDGSGTTPDPVTKKDRYRISKRSAWNTYELKTAGINMDNDDILTVVNGRKYLKVYIPYYFNPDQNNNDASGICGYSYSTSASEWSSITGDNLYTEEEPDPYVLIPQEIAKNGTGTNVYIYLYDNVGNKDYFSVKVICDNTPPEFSVKILPYYTGTNIFDKNIYKKSTFNDNVTEFTYPMSLEGLGLTEDQKKAYDITKPENAVNFYSKGYLQLEFYTTSDDCYESKFEFGTYDSSTKTFTPISGDAKTTISAANIKKDGTNFYPAGNFISENSDGWSTYARASLTDDAGNTTSYYFRFEIDNSAPIMKFDSFYMVDNTSAVGKIYTQLSEENPVLSTDESSPSILYKTNSDSWIQIKQDVETGSGIAKYVAYYRDGSSGSWGDPSTSGNEPLVNNTGFRKKVYTSASSGRENKIEVSDYLGNTSTYYFRILTDKTAPAVNQFIENHVCADSTDCYIDSDNWDASSKELTVYSQSSSLTLDLLNASTVGTDNTDGSGIKGFSLSSDFGNFDPITSINIVEGNNNFYLFDNIGNRTTCNVILVKDTDAPAVIMNAKPTTVSGKNIYPSKIIQPGSTEEDAAEYFINSTLSSDYMKIPLTIADESGVKSKTYKINNGTNNSISSDSIYVYANTTDGETNLLCITVEDNVKNVQNYYLKLQSDVTAPLIESITDSSFSGILNKGNGNVYYNGKVNRNNQTISGLKKSGEGFIFDYMDPVTVTTTIKEENGSGIVFYQIDTNNVKATEKGVTLTEPVKNLTNPDWQRLDNKFEIKLPDINSTSPNYLYIYVEDALGNSRYLQLQYDECKQFINDYVAPSKQPESNGFTYEPVNSASSDKMYYETERRNLYVSSSMKNEYVKLHFTVPADADEIANNDHTNGLIKGLYGYYKEMGDIKYEEKFYEDNSSFIIPEYTGTINPTYYFGFVDYAGNCLKNIPSLLNIIYDDTKPEIKNTVGTSTVNIYPESSITLSNDDSSPSEIYLKSLTAGVSLKLDMYDKANSTSLAKTIKKILYKKTGESSYNEITDFTYNDSDSYVTYCNLSLENSGNESSPYTYEIKAVDKCGNESDSYYISIIPDVTAPVMKFDSYVDESTVVYTPLSNGQDLSTDENNPSPLYKKGSGFDYLKLKLDSETGSKIKEFVSKYKIPMTDVYAENNTAEISTDKSEIQIAIFIADNTVYSLAVKDNVGNENTYYFKEIYDSTAPIVSQFVENKECLSSDDFYVASENYNDATHTLTVYSQKESVALQLKDNVISDSISGIKGFSLSNNFKNFANINAVSVSVSDGEKSFYAFDNTGNTTKCTVKLVQDITAPSVSLGGVSASVDAEKIYPRMADYSNYSLGETEASPLTFYISDTAENVELTLNSTDAASGTKTTEVKKGSEAYTALTGNKLSVLNSGTDGGANFYTIHLEDYVGNSKYYYVKLVTDVSVPVIEEIKLNAPIVKQGGTAAISAGTDVHENAEVLNGANIFYTAASDVKVSVKHSDSGSGMENNSASAEFDYDFISSDGKITVKDKVGNSAEFTIKLKKNTGVTAVSYVNTAEGKNIYLNEGNIFYYSAEAVPENCVALEKYAVSTSSTYAEPAANSYAFPDDADCEPLYLHYKDVLGMTGAVRIGSETDVFCCDKAGPSLSSALFAANDFSTEKPYYTDGTMTGNAASGYEQSLLSAVDSLTDAALETSVENDSKSGFFKILASSTFDAEADSISSVSLTAGEENSRTLYLFDNVGNSTPVKLTLVQSTEAPSVTGSIVASNSYYIDSNKYSTAGNVTASTVTVYSKDSSVDVPLEELTSSNVTSGEGGILGYSSTSSPEYTPLSGSSITVNEGNNTVYIFNKVGKSVGFNITLVQDITAPLFTGIPFETHSYSSETDSGKYAVSSSDWDSGTKTVTVNVKESDALASLTIPLKAVSSVSGDGENSSGILGYSSSSETYAQVESIDVITTTKVYVWDKASNTTEITINVNTVPAGAPSIDTTGMSITAVTTENSAKAGYIYLKGNTIYYNNTEGDAYLHTANTENLIYTATGITGGTPPYTVTGEFKENTVTVTDMFNESVTADISYTWTGDSEAPVVDMTSNNYKATGGTIYLGADNVVYNPGYSNYYTSGTQLQVPVSDTAGVVKYGLIIDAADSISSGTPETWYDAVVSSDTITVGLPATSMYHQHVFLVLKDTVGNISYTALRKPGTTNYTWWCPYIKAAKAPVQKSFEDTQVNGQNAVLIKIEGFTVTSPISKIELSGNNLINIGDVKVQSYTANQKLSASYNSTTITFNNNYILKENDVLEIYFNWTSTGWGATLNSIKCYDITGTEIKSSAGPSGSAFSFSQNLTAVKNTKNAIASVAENFTSVFAPVEVPETQKVTEVTGPEFVRKQLTETFLSITPVSEPEAKPVKSLLNRRNEIVPYTSRSEKGSVSNSHLRNFAEEAENEISELSSIQNNSFLDEEEAVEVKALNVPETPVISAPEAENSAQNRKLSAWFKIAAGIAMLALGITLIVKQSKKRRENGDI